MDEFAWRLNFQELGSHVSAQEFVKHLMDDAFPGLQLRDEVKSLTAAKSSDQAMDILKLISEKASHSPNPTPSGCEIINPSDDVLECPERELVLRRAEAMIFRLVTHSLGNTDYAPFNKPNLVIDCVIRLNPNEKCVNDYLKAKMSVQDAGEKLLFSACAWGTDCRWACDTPNLCLGFGHGLVLCKALTKVDCESRERKKLHHQWALQPGNSFNCKWLLPYCLIKLKKKDAALVLWKYLKGANFFNQSNGDAIGTSLLSDVDMAWNSVQDTKLRNLNVGAVNDIQTGPRNENLGAKRKQIDRGVEKKPRMNQNSLDKFVQEVPFDETNEDSCTICTFSLKESGMYDQGDDSPTTWSMFATCKHLFHPSCLATLMSKSSGFVQCPLCKLVYGVKVGNQPKSITMKSYTKDSNLPGYESYNTIVIEYHGKPGIQEAEHPHPGVRYDCPAFPRRAYLPNSPKGQRVLGLLKAAFDQRLIFTIGTSTTSGRDNVVTWNDIHHKTKLKGGEHGYPDPNYLDAVISDLSQHGIS